MKRIVLFSLVLFPFFTNAQIYVDPTATGDQTGDSWENAFHRLENAIAEATTGAQIWVAEGIYFPAPIQEDDDGNFSYSATFLIDKDIEIYGGFSGNETFLEARDWNANPTILTGRIEHADRIYQVNSVVSITGVSNACMVDGFIIRDGKAIFGTNKFGGGILNYVANAGNTSSPTIKNCQFENNQAFSGGAIANIGKNGGAVNPLVINCKFINNRSTEKGGAIYNFSNNGTAGLIVNNTAFFSNTSEAGGAIYSNALSGNAVSYFSVCEFGNNRASRGGAIFNEVSGFFEGSTHLTNCEFNANHAAAGYGGAVYNNARLGFIKSEITNSIFSENTAGNYGGAMVNITVGGTCALVYNEVRFDENRANSGGAIYNYASGGNNNPTFISTTFYKNYAGTEGAAIYNFSNFNNLKAEILNCTFAKNSSSTRGASIFNKGDAWATLELNVLNSILWDNTITIKNESVVIATVSNSIVRGEEIPAGIVDLGNNFMNQNPGFISEDNGNLQLQPCSPAVDNALEIEFSALLETDFSQIRKIGMLDIGAYENQVERALLEIPNTLFTASYEYTDPQGWTHYYDCRNNILLLSLKKNGQDIGTIGDGTFKVDILTTPNYNSGMGTGISDASYVTSTSCYAMNRYWNVRPTHQPDGEINVRFYFSPQDVAEMIASSNYIDKIEDAYFFKLNNNENPLAKDVPVADFDEYAYDAVAASSTTWTKGVFQGFEFAEYMVSSFSGGGATTGAGISALPVEMIDFTGVEKKGGVALSWSTASEYNSMGFEIQHRVDGTDWEILAFKNSAGESTVQQNYEYQHAHVLSGVHYYRLRAIDFDATYEYSKVIAVNVDNEYFSTMLYPNPVFSSRTIRYNRAGAKLDMVLVYDAQGKEIFRKAEPDDEADELHLPQVLATGIYNVIFISGNQKEIKQLVVQE